MFKKIILSLFFLSFVFTNTNFAFPTQFKGPQRRPKVRLLRPPIVATRPDVKLILGRGGKIVVGKEKIRPNVYQIRPRIRFNGKAPATAITTNTMIDVKNMGNKKIIIMKKVIVLDKDFKGDEQWQLKEK